MRKAVTKADGTVHALVVSTAKATRSRQEVDVLGGAENGKTYTTDAAGRITIPGDGIGKPRPMIPGGDP